MLDQQRITSQGHPTMYSRRAIVRNSSSEWAWAVGWEEAGGSPNPLVCPPVGDSAMVYIAWVASLFMLRPWMISSLAYLLFSLPFSLMFLSNLPRFPTQHIHALWYPRSSRLSRNNKHIHEWIGKCIRVMNFLVEEVPRFSLPVHVSRDILQIFIHLSLLRCLRSSSRPCARCHRQFSLFTCSYLHPHGHFCERGVHGRVHRNSWEKSYFCWKMSIIEHARVFHWPKVY